MKKVCCYLMAAMFLPTCRQSAESAVEPLAVRAMIPVVRVVKADAHEYPFIVRPYHETDLSFRVGGTLMGVKLEPGQLFRRGDIVLSIDSRDFIVRETRAAALLQQAEQEYRRTSALYEAGNISCSTYEKAEAAYRIAQADYETARNELADTQLVAPFDGYVQNVYVQPYQDMKPSQPAVSFIRLDKLCAEVYIPELLAMALNASGTGLQDAVRIRFDCAPDEPIVPESCHVSGSTAGNNLSYVLTAVVDNPQGRWLGGMGGNVSVSLPGGNDMPLFWLPLEAICHDSRRGDYVWLARSGKAVCCPLELGGMADGGVEIVSGLAGNDTVILTRQSFLSENMPVTVL